MEGKHMKTNMKKRQRAFTIIELLTVMSIIVLLISMLVPALNQVRRFAMKVNQSAQLKAIASGLEMFRNDYDDEYPDSGALDSNPNSTASYCGAMKLAEAMMGRDLLGFHPKSMFWEDGGDGVRPLYAPQVSQAQLPDNLKERKGTYVSSDNANAYRLDNLYKTSVAPFQDDNRDLYVLCDVFKRNINQKPGGDNKIGMPVLYYKANFAGLSHDPNDSGLQPDSYGINYYNIYDNDDLVKLGKPDGVLPHVLHSQEGKNLDDFYEMTRNEQIDRNIARRPYRKDSFILISAGWDGEYGTGDDVTNFDN